MLDLIVNTIRVGVIKKQGSFL